MRLDPSAQDLVCMCVCVHVRARAYTHSHTHTLSAQWCLTLCNPTDCSPPGSSDHGIFQARIIEWVAISSSRGSSRPRDQTYISCLVGRLFTPVPPGKSPSRLQFIKHYVSNYTQVKNYKR